VPFRAQQLPRARSLARGRNSFRGSAKGRRAIAGRPQGTYGRLRGHSPGCLAELIGELSMKSEDFRRWWARHDVNDKAHGTKRLDHPVVGPLTLDYETLALPGDGDQTLFIYMAAPGSESETALRLLTATRPDTSAGERHGAS
jgi:MmyB-like transcription regulator ligand binding domain